MIGNMIVIESEAGKEALHLYDLIDKNKVGERLAAFFAITYLVLPIIAACLFCFYKIHKNFAVVSLLLFLLAAIISIVSKDILVYSLSMSTGIDYEVDKVCFTYLLLVISFFVLSFVVLSYAGSNEKYTTRDITESGILIAAALGLNFIKLFPMKTGGSVNLQMLPLFLLALRRGPLKGFISCGIIYGLISCLTDGYGIAFYPFDYLVAFGGAAIMGFFSKFVLNESTNYNIKGEFFLLLGGVSATVIRFLAGTISSMVIYSYEFKPAALYNAGYVFVSGGIALAIIMALYGPILKINKLYPVEK